MSNFIQDRINDGSLVLYHDYRAGHALDLSGQGNDGTPAGTFWASNGLQFSATGEVTIADAAELQLTAGTLVVLGDFHSQNVESLIYKRDAGGTNYDFGITALNICLYDGTNTRILAASVIGHKYVAINMANGDTGEVFIDGVSAGNLDAASVISVDNAPLLIGNDHGDASNTDANMYAALIVNRKLTATEHAQLYAELESLTWPRKSMAHGQGSYGPELVVDGDMEAVGTAAWTATNNATLSKQANRVLGGNQVLRIAHNGTASPGAYQSATLTDIPTRISGWARGDGTGYPRVHLGSAAVWTGTTSTSWQYFDFIRTHSAGLERISLYCIIGVAGYCEFDNVTVKQVYQTQTQFKTDYAAHVSEANVTAGYIENTPFQVSSGTWQVTTDTIDGEVCKVLECVAGGICYIDATLLSGDPTQDAYGTWEWWAYKVDAFAQYIVFISDAIGGPGVGNEYNLVYRASEQIDVRDNAVVVVEGGATTLAHSTWHKFRVTRRQSDGMFQMFINDIILGTPAVDTSHVVSSYICFSFAAGDKIALSDSSGDHCLQKLHGVIAP